MKIEAVCRKLAWWHQRFQPVLCGWTIVYDPKSETKAQCSINEKKRLAVVYAYGRGRMPRDYLFHEILHICFRAIKIARPYKVRREVEEQFVQILCTLTHFRRKRHV